MGVGHQVVKVDLHTHSSCSDGLMTPDRLLDTALMGGIRVLSITDHDTLDGSLQAMRSIAGTPERFGDLILVPGVEVSCRHGERVVHILGYFLERPVSRLQSILDANVQGRKTRAREIVRRLERDGWPVSCSDFDQPAQVMNRLNVARLLVERGAIGSVSVFFDELTGRGCPYEVERHEPDPFDVVPLIRESGGLAVIAHAGANGVIDLIEPLCGVGLSGVEAHHPKHSPDVALRLEECAQSLGLLVTGGSDWHGDASHPGSFGQAGVSQAQLERFLAADPRG